MNREAWLNAAATAILAERFPANLRDDLKYRIAPGVPVGGKRSKGSHRIGECWSDTCSADGHREIFITPGLGPDDVTTPQGILATLAHELVHAVLPPDAGHKTPFKRLATQVGLEGKPTATHAGDDLLTTLTAIAETLGPWPGATLDYLKSGKKKQSTRLIKVACPAGSDEEPCIIMRTTRKYLEILPICSVHSEPLTEA